MDPNDEADVKAAHQLQDEVRIKQADKGRFEIPDWNHEEIEETRKAINVVASTVSDTSKMFGKKEELDPVYWMLGAALGFGGLPASASMYVNVVPEKNCRLARPIRQQLPWFGEIGLIVRFPVYGALSRSA
jgi:hypothetical protein